MLGPVLLVAAALAACSGGGSSAPVLSGPTASPAPTATPTPPTSVPTLAPATAASTVPLSAASQSQTIAIPAAGGISGSIVLPTGTVPAGTTLTVQTTTVAPGGIPALSARRRPLSGSGLQPLYYQGFAFSNSVTFDAYPAFSIVLPAGLNPALGAFQLAFYDGHAWSYPLGKPGVASGQTIAFASAAGPVTYAANTTYYVALYYTPTPSTPTPTPTPTPTVSPSASPSDAPSATPTPTPGPLSVSSTSLTFLGSGNALAQTVTASRTFYGGSFASSDCVLDDPSALNPVAGVAAGSTPGAFVVTPLHAGGCTLTITDDLNGTVRVNVAVATSSVTISSRKKH